MSIKISDKNEDIIQLSLIPVQNGKKRIKSKAGERNVG